MNIEKKLSVWKHVQIGGGGVQTVNLPKSEQFAKYRTARRKLACVQKWYSCIFYGNESVRHKNTIEKKSLVYELLVMCYYNFKHTPEKKDTLYS